MDTSTIIRAWKDPQYRAHLTPAQLAALPESPSGKPLTELEETDLDNAVGGGRPYGGPQTSPIKCRYSVSIPSSCGIACTATVICRPQLTVLEAAPL
jgi:mersacidin/lichenicidin family type 2 lantibiotic